MTFSFGNRSKERLSGVHPDLVKVIEEAIKESPLDFSIKAYALGSAKRNSLVQVSLRR
jgi:peptidoglycan L-alanyl-D-glutamate endopeptidase CwlK